MSLPPKSAFICPNCDLEASQYGHCLGCQVELCDTTVLPPWGLDRIVLLSRATWGMFTGRSRFTRRSGPLGVITSTLRIAIVLASYLALICLRAGLRFYNGDPVLLVLLILSAFPLAFAAISFAQSEPESVRLDRAPLLGAGAALAEGPTRLRGVVRSTTLTYAPTGTACVAFECERLVGDLHEHFTGGATFDLALDDGRRVPVSAQYSRVTHGQDDGLARFVQDGDRVEIIGRVQATANESAGNYRCAGTALALVGTSDEPLLFKRIAT